MNEIEGTAVLIALFALRCIAPVLVTIAIGYFMNKLVDRWQAEDLARTAEVEGEPALIPPEAIETSGLPVQKRRPLVTVPCWIFKSCDESMMADCPARKAPYLPCWMARTRAEGALPDACSDCDLYTETELDLGPAFG